MGIKDNFSQAVKELWKKDGMEEGAEAPAAREGVPTQLDQYLNHTEPQTVQPAAPAQTAAPAPQEPVVQQPAPAQNVQPVAQQPQTAQPVQPQQPAAPQPQAGSNGVPLETPYYRAAPVQTTQPAAAQQPQTANTTTYAQNNAFAASPNNGFAQQNNNFVAAPDNGFAAAPVNANVNRAAGVSDEVTVISKNTVIDGNVRSLANMQVDGSVKGNVETTRDIDMTGKVIGDMKCNNATMNSAAMQGNMTIKGKMRMDRDTILIGDLTSQYADVNGRIRGKLEIAGKAELKRDAIVFGDINASTIAVTDGAIIQGYVNTTFLSKEDSRNAFPDAISLDAAKVENAK